MCVFVDGKEYCVSGTAANHTFFNPGMYVQYFVKHNHPKISTSVGCTVAGVVKLLAKYRLKMPAWGVLWNSCNKVLYFNHQKWDLQSETFF